MSTGRGFLDLERIVVPRILADHAQTHLRTMGRKGSEGFALWVGRQHERVFTVEQTLIPQQVGLHVNGGVCITVDGDELFRINRYLYGAQLSLVAQLHSHPTDAYHSHTDDSYPIATTVGALSLVVPDFAVRPFTIEECAVYRLNAATRWDEMSADAVAGLIALVD